MSMYGQYAPILSKWRDIAWKMDFEKIVAKFNNANLPINFVRPFDMCLKNQVVNKDTVYNFIVSWKRHVNEGVISHNTKNNTFYIKPRIRGNGISDNVEIVRSMDLKEIHGFLSEIWEVFPGYIAGETPKEKNDVPVKTETVVEKPVEQIELLPDVVVCADDDRMLLNAFALAQSKFISDKAIESISAHSRENDVVYDIMLSLFNEDSKTPINDAYNLFYAQYEAYLEKEEKNNINTPFIIYSALPNKIGAFGKWYVTGTPAYVFLMCFIDWHMYCNCYETSFTEVDKLVVNKLGNLFSNTKRRNIQLRNEYAVTNDFIADLATGDCANKKDAVSNWVNLVNGGGIYKQDKNYYVAIVNKGSAQKIEWQIIANSAISKLSEAYVMIDALWKIFPGENPTYAHQKYPEPEFVPSAKFIEGISIKQVQKPEPKPVTAGVNMAGIVKISEIENLIMLGISSAEKIKELQDKIASYASRDTEYQKTIEKHRQEAADSKEKLSVMEAESKKN